MKQISALTVNILLFLSLFTGTISAQNIRAFFMHLPNYVWGDITLDERIKEDVMQKGMLDYEYFSSRGLSYEGDLYFESNVQNTFIRIWQETKQLTLRSWQDGERYLLAVCLNCGDTNGAYTEHLSFYFVYPGNLFSLMSTEQMTDYVEKVDFFKDHVTIREMKEALCTLYFSLPEWGNTILVNCILQEGDGSSERISKALPLIKTKEIELELDKKSWKFRRIE